MLPAIPPAVKKIKQGFEIGRISDLPLVKSLFTQSAELRITNSALHEESNNIILVDLRWWVPRFLHQGYPAIGRYIYTYVTIYVPLGNVPVPILLRIDTPAVGRDNVEPAPSIHPNYDSRGSPFLFGSVVLSRN